MWNNTSMLSADRLVPDFLGRLGGSASALVMSLWEHFPAPMFIARVEHRENVTITAVNTLQQAGLGSELTCLGQPLDYLFQPSSTKGLLAHCARCVEEGVPVSFEATSRYADSGGICRQDRWQILLVPIANAGKVPTHLLGIVQDSTSSRYPWADPLEMERMIEQRVRERTAQLMAANQQLTYQATHDCLTETCNRRHLLELADNEFRRADRYGLSLCLMMLDIDNFKSINDEQGHLAGDQALRTVAQATLAMVRDCDRVGRYGGDEFIIVLPETDIEGARTIAERLSRTLQEAGGICVSIGIASREPDDQSMGELINRADTLLLNAKRNGRNRIECATASSVSRRNALSAEERLGEARDG